MGGSISGSSRTGSRKTLITPKRTRARLIMVASTGRLILMRESVISPFTLRLRGWGCNAHWTAWYHFLDAFHDHFFSRLHSFEHLDCTQQSNSRPHLAQLSIGVA